MTWDIPAMIQTVAGVVNKFVPDRDAQIKMQAELQNRMLEMQSEQLRNQAEVNKIEASHPSVFVAGWRPFIGWVCGAALAWQFIVSPIADWIAVVSGYSGELPRISGDNLFELVLAMLGMAGWRTLDKIKGADTNEVRRATKV